jgi:hypothetical protein
LTYAGRLADQGAPVTATVSASFSIFDAEVGGAAIWTETHPAVAVQSGALSVALGSLTALGSTALNGTVRYLQVTINGQVMDPRMPIRSVPYALQADNATGNITPQSVAVGGKTVINTSGQWVGDAPGLVSYYAQTLSDTTLSDVSTVFLLGKALTVVQGDKVTLIYNSSAYKSGAGNDEIGLRPRLCHRPAGSTTLSYQNGGEYYYGASEGTYRRLPFGANETFAISASEVGNREFGLCLTRSATISQAVYVIGSRLLIWHQKN